MTQRILIMGLPGSGKTYFAERLKKYLEQYSRPIDENSLAPFSDAKITVGWLNADEVRRHYNDWDFSTEGRIRQSLRMRDLADESNTDYCIVDFVAPLVQMRNNFRADWTIWIDTIERGRFEDTNKMFTPPEYYDFRITEQAAEQWADYVADAIVKNQRRPVFDWQLETVQMLGRFQPWHAGHRALFERAIAKTGQVIIQIRDCQGWQGTNPFAIDQVKNLIRRDLDPLYQGQYEIQVVPNITNITYGRDVGYTIEREEFDADISSISATAIRRAMGLE
jgi:phosphopantetheine adenylyltransferase